MATHQRMNTCKDLTIERLHEALDFNQDTGVFTWKVNLSRKAKVGVIAGSLHPDGRWRIMLDRHKHQSHRLAWFYVNGEWPSMEIDHINGVSADNRIANLRLATRAINTQNIRSAQKNNKCGFLGVMAFKDKFHAKIRAKGRLIYLGVFKTAQEAHAAYLLAKRKLHEGCTI